LELVAGTARASDCRAPSGESANINPSADKVEIFQTRWAAARRFSAWRIEGQGRLVVDQISASDRKRLFPPHNGAM